MNLKGGGGGKEKSQNITIYHVFILLLQFEKKTWFVKKNSKILRFFLGTKHTRNIWWEKGVDVLFNTTCHQEGGGFKNPWKLLIWFMNALWVIAIAQNY